MPLCIVSFVDVDQVRHSVEVQAEGLYDAAVLGLAALKKLDHTPGGLTKLDVEVRSTITHTLTVQAVDKWLQQGAGSPKEVLLKERLRALRGN